MEGVGFPVPDGVGHGEGGVLEEEPVQGEGQLVSGGLGWGQGQTNAPQGPPPHTALCAKQNNGEVL